MTLLMIKLEHGAAGPAGHRKAQEATDAMTLCSQGPSAGRASAQTGKL